MGVFYDYRAQIIEIKSINGFSCKALCWWFRISSTSHGIMCIEYHPTYLYYRIIEKITNPKYQFQINDESDFYQNYFKTEKIFDDWMQVNLPMKKLIGN